MFPFFVAVRRHRSNSAGAVTGVAAFARSHPGITECFANVNLICDPRHISSLSGNLTTRHKNAGMQ
jgi:hypothetical protein